jgi:ribosomal protein L22
MSIPNKTIKYKSLKVSFKDSRDLLTKIRNMKFTDCLTYLKTLQVFKNSHKINYSKSSEIIYERLYSLFKKISKDSNVNQQELAFNKIYITKGNLLQISSFKRAYGRSSPKYKKSCHLYVKVKTLNNE